MNVEMAVSPSPITSSSRLSSLNPTRLYFSVFNVCKAKSSDDVPTAICAWDMFRLAVKMSLFMLFLKTTTVDIGMLEVKFSLPRTSQSLG